MSKRPLEWVSWMRALGLAVIGACAVRLTVETRRSGSSQPGSSAQLAAISQRAVAAILRGTGAATGRDGRYLVTWSDVADSGAQGLGLVNELERAGLRAGVPEVFGRLATEHRVLDPAAATARIHVASGAWIYFTGREPGAVMIGYSDRRTPAMRREFQSLRDALVIELERLGRRDAIAKLDLDIRAGDVPGLNPLVVVALGRMVELGAPEAAFVLPIQSALGYGQLAR